MGFNLRNLWISFVLTLPPSVIALLLQVAAFLCVSLLVRATAMPLSPLLFVLFCGTLAAAFSYIAGLARWWLIIQLLFVPVLLLMLSLQLPPNLFLVGFLLLLVVYWSTFRTQVPLYLSSRRIWEAMELLVPAAVPGKSFVFMDLGSGIGGVLTYLAKRRPDGRYHGVEAAPMPFFWSWLRIRLAGYHNCSVRWGDLWDCDLSQFDVVFAYLSPVPMSELWQKARREMRSGTIFISNTFSVIDNPPQLTYTVDDLHNSTLYVWHM